MAVLAMALPVQHIMMWLVAYNYVKGALFPKPADPATAEALLPVCHPLERYFVCSLGNGQPLESIAGLNGVLKAKWDGLKAAMVCEPSFSRCLNEATRSQRVVSLPLLCNHLTLPLMENFANCLKPCAAQRARGLAHNPPPPDETVSHG